jgi:hypothetical protein
MTNSNRLLSLGVLAALVTLAPPTSAAALGPKSDARTKSYPKSKKAPSTPRSAAKAAVPAPAGPTVDPRTHLVRPDTRGSYTQFGKLVGLSVKADGELLSISLGMDGNRQRYSACGAKLADLGHLAAALPHRPEVIVKMRDACVYSVEVGF